MRRPTSSGLGRATSTGNAETPQLERWVEKRTLSMPLRLNVAAHDTKRQPRVLSHAVVVKDGCKAGYDGMKGALAWLVLVGRAGCHVELHALRGMGSESRRQAREAASSIRREAV